jgi:signal transduction histidine kinase
MGSKRIIPTILIGIGFIVTAAFLTGYLISGDHDPWYLLILLTVPLAGLAIMHKFNQSNRQIAFFFEAIRNEDSSLKFPTSTRQKSLRRLYQSLNELNARITEIKLKNEYLEKYYQTFIQQAETGLLALNNNNEVVIMNEKAFEYAGIPSYTPLHLVPSRNTGLFNTLFTVRPGEPLTYKQLTSETQINLLVRSREISFGQKVSRIISLQDIRHELDEKELDSWQKLIRVLTHEIMNSIAPIVSLTGTLRQFFTTGGHPVKPSEMDSDTIENVILGLDTIEERGKGLVTFVDNYRKLTRIPKPEFSAFSVREWLDTIYLLQQARMEALGISYESGIDSRIRKITGDKKLLTQVVINILNNAMEAIVEIRQGRKIRVSAELSKQNRPLLRISNNGPAIPEDLLEKIFIPFFTTRAEGSGIGLSLSRQIMRMHNGYIHVESTESLTSFVIML